MKVIDAQIHALKARGFEPCRIYLGGKEWKELEAEAWTPLRKTPWLGERVTYADLPVLKVADHSYCSVEAVGHGTIADLIEDRDKWQAECERLRQDAAVGAATISDLMDGNASLVEGHTRLIDLLERAAALLDPENPTALEIADLMKDVTVITPDRPDTDEA